MYLSLCLYSKISNPLLLYYHPDLADITHQNPQLELLSLFWCNPRSICQYFYLLTHQCFSPLFICIIGIVGFCDLDKLSLLPLGNTHDPILPVQPMLSFPIQVDVIPVPVFHRLDHTLYFYLLFKRCSLFSHLIISHTIFLFIVPVVLYIECVQFLYNSPEVRSNNHSALSYYSLPLSIVDLDIPV